MRIELLGPSAVGKTTLLLAAEQQRTGVPRWIGPGGVADLLGRRPTTAELRAAMDDAALRPFLRHCIATLADAAVHPSQTLAALTILRRSCFDAAYVNRLRQPVVHDELLLHRGFSLLPHARHLERAARRFYELVPVPDAAVVLRADPQDIVARAAGRTRLPNVYQGLGQDGLLTIVRRCLDVAELATETLRSRGTPVLTIDTSDDQAGAVTALVDFINDQLPGSDMTDDIRDRLLEASGSFRKKDGRHELRTRGVMYCAFSTPTFTVDPADSQRDAAKRVAHFGLTAANVTGRSVLDLGSNAGAMLFQLSNFRPRTGLGIEYDQDKVDIANEIAAYGKIPDLRFRQGDIDKLDPTEIGVHDIVLALAIEGHVNQPERLYQFLGRITGELLCFEGNSNCDMKVVREHLTAAGFTELIDLGFCDDDRDPRNNRRPQLLARKTPARSLARRFRSAFTLHRGRLSGGPATPSATCHNVDPGR